MKAANFMKTLCSTLFVISMMLYSAAFGEILYVPEEYPTIQRAIDESFDGDVILVSDGIYYECIQFYGKRITVASYVWLDGEEGHISKTIICSPRPDKPENRSLVTFTGGEDYRSVLMGFTLRGGLGTLLFDGLVKAGGAILCIDSSPSILKNRIEMNCVSHPYIVMGSGMFIVNNLRQAEREPLLLKCNQFFMNQASGQKTSFGGGLCIVGNVNILAENNCFRENSSRAGGGIAVINASAKFHNNIFDRNWAEIGGGAFLMKYGDGLGQDPINDVEGRSVLPELSEEISMNSMLDFIPKADTSPRIQPELINCTILHNYTTLYGGGIYSLNINTKIMNSIIWENQAGVASDQIKASGAIDITYSDIQGGWADVPNTFNFDSDPNFFEPNSCFLCEDSPCIDAGNPHEEYFDPEDPERPGYALHPAWGTVRNDVGAYGGPCACSWSASLTPEKVMGISPELEIVPDAVELFQNYPNPFNPTTSISFSLDKPTLVELRIFDVQGREVETLISEEMSDGVHKVQWNANQRAGGVYLIQLKTAEIMQVKKMILVK